MSRQCLLLAAIHDHCKLRTKPVVLTSFGKNKWVALLIGGFLLVQAVQAIRTGSVTVIFRTTKRQEDALLFWVGVVLSGALGIAAIVIALM